MQVPNETFSVRDVKKLVGSDRSIDVIDVNTQHGFTMSMREWHRYYANKKERNRTLNVLSLEFSHSPMDEYVDTPHVVNLVSSLYCDRFNHLYDMSLNLLRFASWTGPIVLGRAIAKTSSEKRRTSYRK